MAFFLCAWLNSPGLMIPSLLKVKKKSTDENCNKNDTKHNLAKERRAEVSRFRQHHYQNCCNCCAFRRLWIHKCFPISWHHCPPASARTYWKQTYHIHLERKCNVAELTVSEESRVFSLSLLGSNIIKKSWGHFLWCMQWGFHGQINKWRLKPTATAINSSLPDTQEHSGYPSISAL